MKPRFAHGAYCQATKPASALRDRQRGRVIGDTTRSFLPVVSPRRVEAALGTSFEPRLFSLSGKSLQNLRRSIHPVMINIFWLGSP